MVALIIGPSGGKSQTFPNRVPPRLGPAERKELSLRVLTRTEPVVDLAERYQVSRKFAYPQAHKASAAVTGKIDVRGEG